MWFGLGRDRLAGFYGHSGWELGFQAVNILLRARASWSRACFEYGRILVLITVNFSALQVTARTAAKASNRGLVPC